MLRMKHQTRKLRKRAVDSTPARPVQPGTHEQSGSTGRNAPDGKTPQGADTGQGRYGQSGLAGSHRHETDGESKYRNSEKEGDPRSKHRSNPGSGRAEADETRTGQKPDADSGDVPKTG
jgi:hypothetical protein